MILGENVDSINCQLGYYNNINSIYLPKSLKYIKTESFYNLISDLTNTNISEFPSLEYMGHKAFVNNVKSIPPIPSNRETLPSTINLPQINEFYITAFDYKENMDIFFGESLKFLIYDLDIYAGQTSWQPSLEKVYFHIKSSTPPHLRILASYNGNIFLPYGLTLCIPKGTKQAYEAALPYGSRNYYTLIEEDIPLEQIILNMKEITMDVGETSTIVATLLPECVTDKNIVWSVADNGIASVSQVGEVSAISSGETMIYASSPDGQLQDSCKVIVKAHAESISIEPASIVMSEVGEIKQVTVFVLPENAVDKSVIWKSFNEQVCTVSSEGLVTATGDGTTIVTATTVDGGITATCSVKVVKHVADLSLEKHTLSLKVGDSETLYAQVTPTSADNKSITWSSSNNQVATVDANGNVQALKAGEAWIKAVSVDNTEAKDSCKLTVIQPVTGITISQPTIQFTNIGENIQLEATVLPEDASNKEVTWTSSNESVCMVANGMVVATGYGTAVVMAITKDGGFMASCSVIVEKETISVTGITLSQTSATLKKGETLQLEATVTPDDATNKTLIWKSSDETKCVVTQSGLLVALTEGQAIITVIPENGVGQAQCNVLIVDEGSSISTVSVDASKSEMPIYDIMGQRVLHLVKGHLYICNGQKFIAK